MGCGTSRGADPVVDTGAFHNAGTPSREETAAATQRASRRRRSAAPLPRRLFNAAEAPPAPPGLRETSLDKKLAELNMDGAFRFPVEAAPVRNAPRQPQPQHGPAAPAPAPVVAAAESAPAAPTTAQAPAPAAKPVVPLAPLKKCAPTLPSVASKLDSVVKLPDSVVGMAKRLSSRGGRATGPSQPAGASARPRVAKLPNVSTEVGTRGGSGENSRLLAPGIAPRGPIQSNHGLQPTDAAASRPSSELPGSPRSASSAQSDGSAASVVSAASQRSSAAMRANVDALLRGPWGDIPVGEPRPSRTGSDEQKRRPVVRRRAGSSGSISRSSSAASTASSAGTCSRTDSAGSDASSGGWDVTASPSSAIPPPPPPAHEAASATPDASSLRSNSDTVSSTRAPSIELDKENVGAVASQGRKGKENSSVRKYPTADVRAFVKAARLPATIVPRLLALLAEKDLAKLPVRYDTKSTMPRCKPAQTNTVESPLCVRLCYDV
jgi:hypothetical protein